MAKQVVRPVTLEEFEIKAQEFISLTFNLCEQELHRDIRHHTLPPTPRSKVLPFAALSVQNSIKTFLATIQIKPE